MMDNWNVPLWEFRIASDENCHKFIRRKNMVIFHTYVSLPECIPPLIVVDNMVLIPASAASSPGTVQ